MIKVIASDMDGTLLNSDHKISKENLKAIKKAQDLGVHFVISTGRDYAGIQSILKESDLICECVLMNGAEFRDRDGKIIEKINMDKSKVKDIFKMLNEGDMAAKVFTNDGVYSTETEEEMIKGVIERARKHGGFIKADETIDHIKQHVKAEETKYIDDIDAFIDSDIEIRKIIAFHIDIDVVEKTKNNLRKIDAIEVTSSFKDNIEVTDVSAQKGIMLGKVVDKLGIDRSEVIVLGDSFNDYSMFEEFENSYAMENAIPEIKEVAKYITASNDDNGVAQAIYKSLEI